MVSIKRIKEIYGSVESFNKMVENLRGIISKMSLQERRDRLDKLHKHIIMYNELIRSCPHELQKVSESAWCRICGQYVGWWCPKSPDHLCYYYSESIDGDNNKVRLADGTLIDIPERHNPDHESDDWCIFCGLPYERL